MGDKQGDPKGWSTVLVTTLGSWGNPVSRGHETVGHWSSNHNSLATSLDSDEPTTTWETVSHWPWETGYFRLPSAVISTVDHP
jgi:hypothetical protein